MLKFKNKGNAADNCIFIVRFNKDKDVYSSHLRKEILA
jgi:hypothetical protein